MKKLVVSEKYSRHWPAIAVGSALFAVLFFLLYQLAATVLYEGYLRLASFVFFALSILSFFKVREGKIQIEIQQRDGLIEIFYKNRNEVLYHEEITGEEISEIKIDKMPDRSLYDNLVKSDKCLKIRKNNSKDWLYFNIVNGKVIPLSETNASSIKRFIESRKF